MPGNLADISWSVVAFALIWGLWKHGVPLLAQYHQSAQERTEALRDLAQKVSDDSDATKALVRTLADIGRSMSESVEKRNQKLDDMHADIHSVPRAVWSEELQTLIDERFSGFFEQIKRALTEANGQTRSTIIELCDNLKSELKAMREAENAAATGRPVDSD